MRERPAGAVELVPAVCRGAERDGQLRGDDEDAGARDEADQERLRHQVGEHAGAQEPDGDADDAHHQREQQPERDVAVAADRRERAERAVGQERADRGRAGLQVGRGCERRRDERRDGGGEESAVGGHPGELRVRQRLRHQHDGHRDAGQHVLQLHAAAQPRQPPPGGPGAAAALVYACTGHAAAACAASLRMAAVAAARSLQWGDSWRRAQRAAYPESQSASPPRPAHERLEHEAPLGDARPEPEVARGRDEVVADEDQARAGGREQLLEKRRCRRPRPGGRAAAPRAGRAASPAAAPSSRGLGRERGAHQPAPRR